MPYGHVKQYRDLVREAQKKRIRITKEQQKEIRKLYGEIAADLSSQLSRHSDQTLTYRWLKDYAKELRRESRGVYRVIRDLVQNTMLETANAVTGAESAFWGGLVPELSERFSDVFSKIPDSVVNELLSGGVYRDFTGLSERIWNYQGKFNRDIQYVINQGIIAKKPAYDLAKDLEIYLNPKAAKPFDWSRVYPGIHKTVDYNAQRLARTGVTHAYQMSFQRSTRENPFIEKYKWLSSNSGRSCELCRQRNGRLFEKDELPLDHPNGMCTVIAVIPKSYEQIADELVDWANGKENPGIENWLNPDSKHGSIIFEDIFYQGEKGIFSKAYEVGIAYDKNGKELFRLKGSESKVTLTHHQAEQLRGNIFTHNHPSNAPFSDTDLWMMWKYQIAEIRVVTKQGVFSAAYPETWKKEFTTKAELRQEFLEIVDQVKPKYQKKLELQELSLKEANYRAQCEVIDILTERYGIKYELIPWED